MATSLQPRLRFPPKALPSAAVATALLLAGCGGGKAAVPDEGTNPSGNINAPTSTITNTIPGDPVPAGLRGTWQLVSVGKLKFKHPFQVALTDNEYWLKGTDVHGNAVTKGNEIDFYAESLCNTALSGGIGRYRWHVDGKTLHLGSIEKDPCSDRSGTLNDAVLRRPG